MASISPELPPAAFLAALLFLLAFGTRRVSWIPRDEAGDLKRKLQRRAPTSSGGFACLAATLASLPFGPPAPVLSALVLALAVGALDDRLGTRFRWTAKLGAQFLVALFAALLLPTAGIASGIPAPLVALWLVLSMNAANFYDNHDGALPQLGIVNGLVPVLAAAGLLSPTDLASFFGTEEGGRALRLALLLVACLCAFLPWNWPKARAYLGDMGSHFCGMAFGILSLEAWQGGLPFLALGFQGLLFLDFVQVCIVRLLVGDPPWIGDRRHLAHRLAGLLPAPLVAPALALVQGLCLWILAAVPPGG